MRMRTLQEIVDASKRLVFFGGAGVSTASGIPDFSDRDVPREDGLTPQMLLSRSFFYLHPEQFFDFYRREFVHPDAQPNAAHRKLFELERAGKLTALVTQNVDGLHRAAGNRLVYELHGSIHENACMDCGRRYGLDAVLRAGHPALRGLRRRHQAERRALRRAVRPLRAYGRVPGDRALRHADRRRDEPDGGARRLVPLVLQGADAGGRQPRGDECGRARDARAARGCGRRAGRAASALTRARALLDSAWRR